MKTKQSHISKTIKFIVLSLVIMSCSNQELATTDLKVGKYAWIQQSTLKTVYYKLMHNSIFELGDTLTLFDNDDFGYTNCGYYGFGKYQVKGDSLYLTYDSSAYQSDSIMFYDNYTDVYFIEDENTLSMKFGSKVSKEAEVSFYGISELHYIENSQTEE